MPRFRLIFACVLLIISNSVNGQLSKEILIKSVESYVLLNHQGLYELFSKEKMLPCDSFYTEVDSGYMCIKGKLRKDNEIETVLCMYEGTNNEIYSFDYGDLNNDGIQDAIVSFTLEGFGGGNGYGRFHATIINDKSNLTLSSVSYYYPQINFNSITKGIIYGEQYGYDDNDGRCCPSLMRDVIYQFENNKLIPVKDFEYKKQVEKSK